MRYTTVRLVVTLVLLIIWAPLAAYAQQPTKVPRLGVLRPEPASPCRFNTVADGLRELGYVEGHTLITEWRCGDGTPARARELAVELVQLPVDVFLAVAADGPWRPCRRRAPSPLSLWACPSRWPWGWSPAWRGRAGTSPA